MKSTVENLSPTRVRLAVEVPFDDLKPSLDKAYKELAAQVRVPGFRPGKVPARIIDQRVGRGAVLQEAVNEALPRFYGEAAREHDLAPLGQPEIDITNLDDTTGGSLSFTAEVDVRPEITLPELDGIAVTVDDADVTDADIDEQLNELRDRFGTLKGVDRPAEAGDYVSLDLVSKVGDEEVEGGSAKGLSYVVGSDDLVDGLDEAITGKSAGDTATLTTTLRQGEHVGSEAEVTATIKSVKVKELPEVDDEFAQLASEFDTVAELRDDLRERLGRVKALEQGAQARDKLLEHLIEIVEFPLPESAVKSEVEYREHDIVHSLGHDDALFERYLEAQGKTREEFEAELHRERREVRSRPVHPRRGRRPDRGAGRGRRAHRVPRPAGRALPDCSAGVRQPDRPGREPADAGGRHPAQQGPGRDPRVGDGHGRLGQPGRPERALRGRRCSGCRRRGRSGRGLIRRLVTP